MSDYNEQMDIAKKVMAEDRDALSKIHNTKSIQQLCVEYPHLDIHIHKLDKTITDLEKNNLDLRITITNLHNQLEENKKWTATVYDPNKPSYKQLEDKLALAENSKQTEIDELYETKIGPLQNQVQEKDNLLDIANHKNQCKDSRIKQLEEIIKDQQTIINYAAGYISACEQFRDKHPTDVIKWLFEGLK